MPRPISDRKPPARLRIVIAFFACTTLAAVTYAVVTQPVVTLLDLAAVGWARAHAGEMFMEAMRWASLSGGPSITAVYAGILIVVYLARRRLATAAAIATIVYGGAGLNVALKELVHRGRPIVEDALTNLPTYSFPSGHAAAATVFGGVSIMLVSRSWRRRPSAAVIGAIVVWIALVCASRIYLGAHYPSDVLAGLLEGIAWVMLCSLALDRWHLALTGPTTAGPV
jgi:membrane-associated phospholipid phosphatase